MVLETAGGLSAQESEFVARAAPSHGSFLRTPPVDSERSVDELPAGLTGRIENVAWGHGQVEFGYALVTDTVGGVGVTQHAVPDLLVRLGITERLELRLGWPGYVSNVYDTQALDSDETLDPNIGFMYDLCLQRGILPQTAVVASVPITLEGNPFALDSLQPLTQLLYRWDLNDRVAIGGTTGVALFDVGGDRFTQFQQTLNVDFAWTDRLGLFGEWEMLADAGSVDDGSQHMLGGGVSAVLTDCLFVTWRTGVGVNSRAPDFLTDVRFAWRF